MSQMNEKLQKYEREMGFLREDFDPEAANEVILEKYRSWLDEYIEEFCKRPEIKPIAKYISGGSQQTTAAEMSKNKMACYFQFKMDIPETLTPLFKELFVEVILRAGRGGSGDNEVSFEAHFEYSHPSGGSNGHTISGPPFVVKKDGMVYEYY